MKILYLARLRETLGRSLEELDPPKEAATVGQLIEWLRARGEPFHSELAPEKRFRVAVNQELAQPTSPVKIGDEVAFFPPVTGG